VLLTSFLRPTRPQLDIPQCVMLDQGDIKPTVSAKLQSTVTAPRPILVSHPSDGRRLSTAKTWLVTYQDDIPAHGHLSLYKPCLLLNINFIDATDAIINH